MDIEKGNLSIRFNDHNGDPHAISIKYGTLEFQVHLDSEEGGPYCAVFTQEQIKALLPYLQAYAETGQLEADSDSQLTPLAQSILDIITESTQPPKSSYIAGWHICDQLGISRTELDCSFTEHDKALKELMDAGLVEELPDLGCRYRLKKQEQQ